jgi:hypothetical protein
MVALEECFEKSRTGVQLAAIYGVEEVKKKAGRGD